MTSFDGFLDFWKRRNSCLELRFIAGGLEPWTDAAPVLDVEVESPDDISRIAEELAYLQEREDNVYVECISTTQLALHPDHGDRIDIVGRSVTARSAPCELTDCQRMIALHFERVNDRDTSLAAMTGRARLVRLARWVEREIDAKLKCGKLADAERADLERQLGFAKRVIDALEV